MAEGYIKLYRRLTAHPLWEDKPFSKGQAWIDLLLAANHAESRFYLGRTPVTAAAGQVVTSEVKLADRWGWSRQKVRNFLALLTADGMLTKTSGKKMTVLTLCADNIAGSKGMPGKRGKKESGGAAAPPSSPLERAIEDFKAYRTAAKKPMTKRAVELLWQQLEKLAGKDEGLQIAILEQSILRGWTGVFPLRDGVPALEFT